MAEWKDKLIDIDMGVEHNIDDVYEMSKETKMEDVGMVNPNNGAGMLVRDSGKIEAFSDYALGFVMDPETQSFSIYAPNLKMFFNKKEEIKFNQDMSILKNEYDDVLKIIKERD